MNLYNLYNELIAAFGTLNNNFQQHYNNLKFLSKFANLEFETENLKLLIGMSFKYNTNVKITL